MSSHLRRTLYLVGALVLLLGIDLVVHIRAAIPEGDVLPTIERVDPGTVTEIHLSQGDTDLKIERTGPEEWRITEPFDYPADRGLVVTLLQAVRRSVHMDVRVDEGHAEQYGLTSPEAVRVTLKDAGEGVLVDYYVGHNAAGGSSFVRFPDSDVVYRARVGGRQRYDRKPGEWRNHMLLGFSGDVVEGLSIETVDTRLEFARPSGLDERGRPEMGDWALPELPDFKPDQAALDELVTTLVTLRAGEILSPEHPAGLEHPEATVVLTVLTGDTFVVQFGRTEDGTFAQLEGQPEILRVSDSVVVKLQRPLHTWRDRSLMSFARPQVHRITLVEPDLTSVLEQDPATSSWRVTQPANVAADLRQAMFNARTMGKLRAEAIADITPEQAGFPSQYRMEVTLLDGSLQVVEIGAEVPGRTSGTEAVYVRTPDQPQRIGILPAKTVSQLRRAWAR